MIPTQAQIQERAEEMDREIHAKARTIGGDDPYVVKVRMVQESFTILKLAELQLRVEQLEKEV